MFIEAVTSNMKDLHQDMVNASYLETEQGLSSSFYRAINAIIEALFSWPNLILIMSQSSYLQIPLTYDFQD